MITSDHPALSPESLKLLTDIEKFLEANEDVWSDDNLSQIAYAGMTSGLVNPEIFERTFTLPMRFPYAYSNADRYLTQFEFRPSRSLAALEELGAKIELFAQTTLDSYALPGYLFTSRFQSERTRIPVHVHKNVRSDADGSELNLSIALRLKKADIHPCVIRFYPEVELRPDTFVHESLIQTSDYRDVEIDKMVSVFIFDARKMPHTVFFSEDIVLWAVIGGARLRLRQPDADILVDKGPFDHGASRTKVSMRSDDQNR